MLSCRHCFLYYRVVVSILYCIVVVVVAFLVLVVAYLLGGGTEKWSLSTVVASLMHASLYLSICMPVVVAGFVLLLFLVVVVSFSYIFYLIYF